MPTYEYECDDCHHHFDATQRMSDPPLRECPKCGKGVHRVLSSGIGIAFQGSGFYTTDSKKSAGTPEKTPMPSEKASGVPERTPGQPAPPCAAGCPHCPEAKSA